MLYSTQFDLAWAGGEKENRPRLPPLGIVRNRSILKCIDSEPFGGADTI